MTFKNIYLWVFVVVSLFHEIQTLVNPQLLFQLDDGMIKVYQVKAVNQGTQLYVSCTLNDSSFVIRKYLVAGNQYFLKGSYLGPGLGLSSNFYDYIFVTSGYLISGSKTTGQMHLWNLTSFSFISEISSSIYAVKILYSSSLQKLCYIQTLTYKIISISTASLPLLTFNISYWTANDIELSPINNYLALMNDVNSTTVTIIKLSNLNYVNRIYGAFTGYKTATWSSDDMCLFMTTIRILTSSVVTFVQMFNMSSLQSTQTTQTSISGDGGGTNSIIMSSYNYTVTGISNNILFLEKSAELLLPYNSLSNSLSLQSIQYPVPKRLLQTLLGSYQFNLTFTTQAIFLYQDSKSYFSVIIDGLFYYFSLYDLCLDNQYFDTTILTCNNCSIGCAICTYETCIQCSDEYYFDNLDQCIYNESSISTKTESSTTNKIFNLLKLVFSNLILRALNKVPASRKVLKPLFRFFVNLDDLWLYYYHKRSYCNTTLEMFQSIQDLQNEKWELLHAQKILDKLQVSEQDVESYFSYLDAISKSKDNFVQRQKKNSGYFINSLNFYMTNLALIIATFIILRLIFKILQTYFISVFFREYSFYVFLGIMIMEGNLQYFVYLITNQMQMLSDDIFSHKLSHIYALLTFLSLFSFSCICFIVLLFAYERKHSKYFFDNTKVNFKGSFYLFMACFMKNIMLGFIHSYFNYNYVSKIFLLWSVQFLFLLVHIIILAKKDIESSTRQWVIITCGFLRLLIIFSFYLDYRLGVNFANLQSFQQSLFMAYLMVGLLSLSYQIISFIYQSIVLSRKYVFQTSSVKVYQDSSDSISENKYKKTLNAVSKMKYSSTSKYFSRKRSSFKAFKIESVQDTLSLSSNNQNLNNIEIQQSKLFQAFQTKKTIKKNPFQRIRIKKNGLKKQFQKLQVQSQQKKSYQ